MLTDYLPAGAGILAVVIILAQIWLIVKLKKLDQIRQHFYAGGTKNDLEEVLVDQNRKVTSIAENFQQLDQRLSELASLNRHNVQKIGFVRFNPFDDAGGNISFALALLSGENNGVVVSSLHAREGTRIYAKNIKNGKSESKLTEEETTAINQAS